MTCSKYTATVSNSTLGDIATATVYLDPTYAVTVGFDFTLTDSFVKQFGGVASAAEAQLESLFDYAATTVDFSIDTTDIPDYDAIMATLVD